jgi:hypothetical protein
MIVRPDAVRTPLGGDSANQSQFASDAVSALPAEPDLGGPEGAASECGGCFVVADVDQVVWYSAIFANVAAMRSVDVIIGNNTRATRTTLIVNEAQFTIEPNNNDEEDGTDLALTSAVFNSSTIVNGATL